MSQQEIRAKILQEIAKQCKNKQAKDLKDTMNLELDLGIDSLNRVELASNLLDIFAIENAPIEEAAQLMTVGQVVEFVLRLTAKKAQQKV